MKIALVKTLLAISLGLGASSNIHANPHQSSNDELFQDSYKNICEIPIPNTTFDNLTHMFAANFHSINRILNMIFAAEAFTLHPISITLNNCTSPPTIHVADTHIAELIEAANGDKAGSIGEALTSLSKIFQAFGINSDKVISALKDMTLAAGQYSIAVANGIPSNPYIDVWINAGDKFCNALILTCDLEPNSEQSNSLKTTIHSIITNQANSVRGFNGVLELSALLPCKTQSAAALKFDQMARISTIELYRVIALQITKIANKESDCIFSQLFNVYDQEVSFLQQITRDLDIFFAAEAFAPHPVPVMINKNTSPSTINIENPHLAELVNAVNGDCIGSIPYSLEKLTTIGRKFGIRLKLSSIPIGLAAEQYSIAVANYFSSTPYFIAWLNASMNGADELARAFDLKPNSQTFLKIQSDFLNLAVNGARCIQGFNGILPSCELLPEETQSAAAFRFLQQSHIAIIGLDFTISKLLIKSK